MSKDENELAQRLGVMGLADGKFIRSLHVDRLSPSAVAEALHVPKSLDPIIINYNLFLPIYEPPRLLSRRND